MDVYRVENIIKCIKNRKVKTWACNKEKEVDPFRCLPDSPLVGVMRQRLRKIKAFNPNFKLLSSFGVHTHIFLE